jgi:hypothetical protein
MSLVLELQAKAMDLNCSISELLLRAKVVAAKLNLTEFSAWVDSEINGWKGQVPDYRFIQGQMMVSTPLGAKPLHIGMNDLDAMLSKLPAGMPIEEIDAESRKDGAPVTFSFPSDIRNILIETYGNMPLLAVSRNVMRGIVSIVRKEILDWTLKLEKDGILGKDMTFNEAEKQAARENKGELNYVTINIHSMTDSAIQVDSQNAVQQLKRIVR